MKFKHTHFLPPMLFISKEGKKYICPTWIEVPMDTCITDIEWINPYIKHVPKINVSAEKEWHFKSSSQKDVIHTVRIVKGAVQCSCPGAYRSKSKECKHIKSVKSELQIK